jgi:hypothetical protein
MNDLIAIDPGRTVGVAVFHNERLFCVEEFEVSSLSDIIRKIEVLEFDALPSVVIELPQVYPVRKWKGDPNDLIQVAYIAGAIAGLLRRYAIDIKTLKPHEWKGNTPKKIDNRRTFERLTPSEQEIVKAASNHVLDAVGIGLHVLKRK